MAMKVSSCFRNDPSVGFRATVTALLGVFAIALCAAPVRADRSTEMATQIARLRAEVEDLSSRIEAGKDAMLGQLRSYSAQKAELEMEIQRAELTLDQLNAARQRRAEAMQQDDQRAELLRPVFVAAIARIKQRVSAGLPFQVAERIADLEALERQLGQGLVRVPDAIARLWDRVEDEFRLSREHGLYKQVIRIDGREQLVDVARVGMVALYFRTGDGRSGMAVREGGGWKFETLASKQAQAQIATLFESFRKQIRVGFFMLPDALPAGGTP
jgi:hypothetical protein